ncbi:hypothetical protein ACFY15_15540 [Streptomyces sp. NPDC001373]|uniref:hypothetical protein n=1 Tax=Streptomyces sp. NPDC001373 TaxID=3364565 RepID=UPI0036925FD0
MTPPSDRAGHQPEPATPLPRPQPSDEAGVPAARNTDRRSEAATGTETGAEPTRENNAPQDGPEERNSRAGERDGISHLSWEQNDRPAGSERDGTAHTDAASSHEGTSSRDSGATADREEAGEGGTRPVSTLEFDEDDRDPEAPAADAPDQNEDAAPPDTPDADGRDLSTPVVPAQDAPAVDSTTPVFATPDATTQVAADPNAAGALQPTEAPSSGGAEHTTATTTVQAERERPDTTGHLLPPPSPALRARAESRGVGEAPEEDPDPGAAEDVNEPDSPLVEEGDSGDPEKGDQRENPLADVAGVLSEKYPEVASVITKLGADNTNKLNVIESLKDAETRGGRTLEIIQELAEGETLEGRSLEEYRSENPGRGPLFEPVEHEVNHKPDGTSRKDAYVEQAKVDDPVRALGASIEGSDRVALDDYSMRLQNEVEPSVCEDVTRLLEEAGGDDQLSIRTKSASGLVDKVERMVNGSDGRKPRPDYKIGDVIDAVGARITVDDTARLEIILEKSKEYLGVGEGGRLLEVENMYAEPKGGNPSYRVIPMVVSIEVEGKPYTYELQLTTRRASVAADLEHNTVYKSHIETTPEERDVMRRMQAEASALDQEETRRRYP